MIEMPEELKRRSSRLEWIHKAKPELEAEAATAKAAQRQQEAAAADKEATEAEASGDDQTSKRASRRERGACKRADDAHKLANEKAEAASLGPLTSLQLGSAISWRCRSGSCPPMRAGTPNPRLRGTSQTLTATSSRGLTVGSRATTPRPLSMATTR